MSEVESWRAVPGFPGYEVSDQGRLRSYRTRGGRFAVVPRVLSPIPIKSGYLQHGLRREGRTVCVLLHRAVLEAFVGPCPDGMECRHFPDRDGHNCRLDNLAWGTVQENADDRVVHGTVSRGLRHGALTKLKTPRGVDHPCTVHLEGNMRVVKMLAHVPGLNQSEIGAVFKIPQATVSKVKLGKIWGHI